MYSTLIITPAASHDDALYFARNSNRPPSECQLVTTLSPVANDASTRVKCTHIQIDQVPQRYGIVLSKPWWAWGGEMGVNDQGVVFSCQTVSTRDHESEPGLTGMDLVRLGLERAGTADEGLKIITALLQTYGQGGPEQKATAGKGYDHTFLITDILDTWLLETAGRHWVAKRVKDVAALAPVLMVSSDFEQYSYALPQYAQHKGWLSTGQVVNFRKIFTCGPRLRFNSVQKRRETVLNELRAIQGKYVCHQLMDLLREGRRTFAATNRKLEIAHQAGGWFRRVQTTGSMVTRVTSKRQDIFVTGTSSPGLSLFKPVHFGLPLEAGPERTDLSVFNTESLWWRHEQFHRAVLLGRGIEDNYFTERAELERSMLTDLLARKGGARPKLIGLLQQRLMEWEESKHEDVLGSMKSIWALTPTKWYWSRQSKRDRLPLSLPGNDHV